MGYLIKPFVEIPKIYSQKELYFELHVTCYFYHERNMSVLPLGEDSVLYSRPFLNRADNSGIFLSKCSLLWDMWILSWDYKANKMFQFIVTKI